MPFGAQRFISRMWLMCDYRNDDSIFQIFLVELRDYGTHHQAKHRNSAKLTLREYVLCAILCNPERVLNVLCAVSSVPKSEFCSIAKNATSGRLAGPTYLQHRLRKFSSNGYSPLKRVVIDKE